MAAESTKDYDYLFKFLLIGDSGVGKSTLMTKICDETFSEEHISTIGVDFKIYTDTIDDKVCKLQIWDTAGQERFRVITSSYYRGAHGIFLCFDLTDRGSFLNLGTWKKEISKYARDSVMIILVGIKTDLESKRKVDFEQARELADSNAWTYVELSSKMESPKELAAKIFFPMVKQIRSYQPQTLMGPPSRGPGAGVSLNDEKKNGKCCTIM